MHKLLERQLRAAFGGRPPPELAAFLGSVDATYRAQDDDRVLLERSLELTSQEMLQLNESLAREVRERRESEAGKSAIIESAIDCIIMMDEGGLVREFNPASERTFGYRRDEAVGRPLADLIIPPEVRGAHAAGLGHYLRTGEGPALRRRIEVEAVRKDGTRLPVELAIIPFVLGERKMFAGYLRDLTERQSAQEEIRRRNALVQLLNQVPVEANEAATVEEAARVCLDRVCEYTGWPVGHAYFVDDAAGVMRSHGVWHLGDPSRYEVFRAVTEGKAMLPGEGLPGRVWEQKQPAWIPDVKLDENFPRAQSALDIGVRGAFAFPVAAGPEVLAVLEFFSPSIQKPDPELLRTMSNVGLQLGRVLQRKRQEDDLRLAYARLKEVDHDRTRFLNTAAHELGTPLTPIKLQVQIVKTQMRTAMSTEQRRSMDILERNVDRLGHLVKDLLDAARMQSGQLRVAERDADLGDLAEQSVEAYRVIAREVGVALESSVAPGLPVRCDPDRMGQVLDNLIANAIKFTPAGGRILVEAAREADRAVVRIRDDGIGIDPAAIARLFTPFSQVHDTMQVNSPGSGLGLYIARGIVEQAHGTIRCDSAGRGKGAVFTVSLPVRGGAEVPGPGGAATGSQSERLI